MPVLACVYQLGRQCNGFSIICCSTKKHLLGDKKGIWPVKKLNGWVLAWLSVWSEVQSCI